MVDPPVTPKQEQATAHARGRICKVRSCKVCAPRREQRRAKKAERRAVARARQADTTPVPTTPRVDGPVDDPETVRRHQGEKHRAGLPCGVETCASQVCVEGFARERARRHRARRPCRSSECANPICVASRT